MEHRKSTVVPADSHPSDGELIDLLELSSNTDPYISYRSYTLAI